ncbi:MAG: hypothetical protein M3125_07230, partial [Gemmatimonadota bacterium]|nr:hypothetical protein [Gemmatimonadota bacterium]
MEDVTSPRRPLRRWRIALVAAGLLVLGTMVWWGPRLLAEMSFFRLRRVHVVGARYVPADT